MTTAFLSQFRDIFPHLADELPWHITRDITQHLYKTIETLDINYTISNGIAIHKNAIIEQHVILKPPVIISEGCFVAAHAYLRGGVFLANHVSIGPGCEIKSTVIMHHTVLAHFNFAGDSLIGANVNMEAGSILANYFNERSDKSIRLKVNDFIHTLDVQKFGALIGDSARIGANAVLSPGTALQPGSVVKRLELVDAFSDEPYQEK